MTLMAQLDRRGPLVKLGQKSGFNLFKPPLNPLLVFVSEHSLNYKGMTRRRTHQIAGVLFRSRRLAELGPLPSNHVLGASARFLSTTYPHPIPLIPAKPHFSPVR